LALLLWLWLWLVAGLAALTGSNAVAIAIVAVIALNAVFAFVQEQQAEKAVELLSRYLPARASVLRGGRQQTIAAAEIVTGDILIVTEGERISADARLLQGSVEIDTSTLTGEAVPVLRTAGGDDADGGFLEATDLVFSGATCTAGDTRAVVFATGMRTQLGRIAALSQHVEQGESPLEGEVRRVAWIIAIVAVAIGLAFLPLGTLAAGLSFSAAAVFAIGLLVGTCPRDCCRPSPSRSVWESEFSHGRARWSSDSAQWRLLGSTTVICTDKTGTLTENRMHVVAVWTTAGDLDLETTTEGIVGEVDPELRSLATALARCTSAVINDVDTTSAVGDPTETAMLLAAPRLELPLTDAARSIGEDNVAPGRATASGYSQSRADTCAARFPNRASMPRPDSVSWDS
jgi:magnesium-transporting ATPase (P-type)